MKRYALLLLLLPAIAAACGGGKKSSSPSSSTSATTSAASGMNNHGTKDVSGMSSVSVEMDDYYFSPTILKGTPGQKITINFSNDAKVEHNFSITSDNINHDVEGGKTATVQATFPKSGTLGFFCKYHKSLGMTGELTTGTGTSSGGSTTTGSSTTSSGY